MYKIYRQPWYRVADLFWKRKNYDEYYALHNLDVNIPKGEAIGVLGKNGAGKSTLLKIITGVTTPTSGNIEVEGNISAILDLTAGFDKELSGIENIYLKALAMGMQKKEMDEKLDDIISFADIGQYINQPVRTYSTGMRSRLGFAISVNVDPDILIVDEALAVGDDVFKLKCINKMKSFREAGKTILFVSHSLFTVKAFCTKAMWIKDGELMTYGETGEVTAVYENFLKEEKAKEKLEAQQKALENNTDIQMFDKREYLQFSNFKMQNNDGERADCFKQGDDIIYEVDYEVKKEIPEIKFCLTIRDAETREIFGSDKRSENHILDNSIGKHHIKVRLKDLNLLPGKYLLSGEAWDNQSGLFIGYSNKRPFYIESDEFMGTGIWYINHEYEIS
jgi:teichoic acid transport system ATP-binding protein